MVRYAIRVDCELDERTVITCSQVSGVSSMGVVDALVPFFTGSYVTLPCTSVTLVTGITVSGARCKRDRTDFNHGERIVPLITGSHGVIPQGNSCTKTRCFSGHHCDLGTDMCGIPLSLQIHPKLYGIQATGVYNVCIVSVLTGAGTVGAVVPERAGTLSLHTFVRIRTHPGNTVGVTLWNIEHLRLVYM